MQQMQSAAYHFLNIFGLFETVDNLSENSERSSLFALFKKLAERKAHHQILTFNCFLGSPTVVGRASIAAAFGTEKLLNKKVSVKVNINSGSVSLDV